MTEATRLLAHHELAKHGIKFTMKHIRALEGAGKFPRRVHIGDRTVCWVEDEIKQYVAARIAARGANRRAEAA